MNNIPLWNFSTEISTIKIEFLQQSKEGISLLTRKDFHEDHSSQKILHTLKKLFRLWLSSLQFFDLLILQKDLMCTLSTDLHVKRLEHDHIYNFLRFNSNSLQ